MGGGIMRTAARAAVIGGYRSASSVEQATAGALRASVSAASAPAGEGVASISHSAQIGAFPVVYSGHNSSEEVGDWVFAGGKEEDLFDSLHPAPRLIFGPVPTLVEAKEATADLKDALEKIYFSPTAATYEAATVAPRSSSSGSTCLENLDARMCVTGENATILPSAPKHVVQAFSLLQGSPEAQDVVASLVSDKNVWDVVMKNQKVMEFYKSHQAADLLSPETKASGRESNAGYESVDGTPEFLESSENGFMSFMHSVKLKVSEMVSNLSDFFLDLLGTSTGSSSSAPTQPASTNDSFVNVAIGSSFIALAVATILVVLVKRG